MTVLLQRAGSWPQRPLRDVVSISRIQEPVSEFIKFLRADETYTIEFANDIVKMEVIP